MALLKISLLGSFQAWLGGIPVTSFKSNKVRALLAYLAVEKDRPHSREKIAGLLWPDYPERSALGNLRWALSSLRTSIEDRSCTNESVEVPHILARRESLQFNNASDYRIDVATFLDLSCKEITQPVRKTGIDCFMEAVSLYRGSFLEGFSLPDSAPFEEWVLVQREYLSRLNLQNLCLLADYFESRSEYEKAQRYVLQKIELEPWQEEAHQQLMRLLALSGKRSEAMIRFEKCRNLLREGLGVEPSKETRLLYEKIRDGLSISGLPAPVEARLEIESKPNPIFVSREKEVAHLRCVLERVISGHGQVLFITGEAGAGKTVLIREFIRRSLVRIRSLTAILGRCNAQPDIGDPYSPFLEAFHMLTGNIQPQWIANGISTEHVRRLIAIVPEGVKAILEVGPGLIDNFVSERALIAGIRSGSDSQVLPLDNQIASLVNKKGRFHQIGLFEEYLCVLQHLARTHPIILVIDDLQWIDPGSLSLLCYLGRRLEGSRILLLGAYRPDELILGWRGHRHPLESVVNELEEELGEIRLEIPQTSSRNFVDALIDAQSNRLGDVFRETLDHHTGGNPMFTVELLKNLAERGDIVRNQSGEWVEGEKIDWNTLPPRVKAAIAERTQRLPLHLQELLLAASVQGVTFIAEVLAAMMGSSQVKISEDLSSVLNQQHHLVDGLSIYRDENTSITRYKFRNTLVQKYLYQNLDPVKRAHLHQKTGEVLEIMVSPDKAGLGDLDAAPANPAWHFEQAGIYEKAVDYLLRAGRRAYALSSNEQAIVFYKHGIGLISSLPESESYAHRELPLQIALQAVLQSQTGYHSPEVGRACARGVELAAQVGDPADRCASLFSLFVYYTDQAEYTRSLDLVAQLDSLASSTQVSESMNYARLAKGLVGIFLGDFRNARQHLQFVIDNPSSSKVEDLHSPLFQDIRLIARIFICLPLWFLGYPDQALHLSEEAIHIADGTGNIQSQGLVSTMAGGLVSLFRKDCYKTRDFAENLFRLSKVNNLQSMKGLAAIFLGRYLTELGRLDEGYASLQEGLVACQAQGLNSMSTLFLAMLAEACSNATDGLRITDEALALARENGERMYLAEIYRIRGELLLTVPGLDGQAESCLRRALLLSRIQGARSLELRAATSLARLYTQQHQSDKAYTILARIFEQFTEGFGTLDLRHAQQLLEELSSTSTYADKR